MWQRIRKETAEDSATSTLTLQKTLSLRSLWPEQQSMEDKSESTSLNPNRLAETEDSEAEEASEEDAEAEAAGEGDEDSGVDDGDDARSMVHGAWQNFILPIL